MCKNHVVTIANPTRTQRAIVYNATQVIIVQLLVIATDHGAATTHALIGARGVSKAPELPMIMN